MPIALFHADLMELCSTNPDSHGTIIHAWLMGTRIAEKEKKRLCGCVLRSMCIPVLLPFAGCRYQMPSRHGVHSVAGDCFPCLYCCQLTGRAAAPVCGPLLPPLASDGPRHISTIGLSAAWCAVMCGGPTNCAKLVHHALQYSDTICLGQPDHQYYAVLGQGVVAFKYSMCRAYHSSSRPSHLSPQLIHHVLQCVPAFFTVSKFLL